MYYIRRCIQYGNNLVSNRFVEMSGSLEKNDNLQNYNDMIIKYSNKCKPTLSTVVPASIKAASMINCCSLRYMMEVWVLIMMFVSGV